MAPTRLPIIALLLSFAGILALGSGCVALKGQKEKLKITSLRYNENVRWQRFKSASEYVTPDKRDTWRAAMERAGKVFKITEYEIIPVTVEDGLATINIDLSYLAPPGVTVQKMRRQQTWRYADGDWLLYGDKEIKRENLPPPTRMPDLEEDPIVDEDAPE